MNPEKEHERELVLPPNSFCHILDETKGGITVYVGPNKTSLANSDRPVTFDTKTKRFRKVLLEEAIKSFSTAPEGWYQVLKNPASKDQPKSGSNSSLGDEGLNVGRKVNIPGPSSFALWPGQMVKVVQGHHLRSNQYLVVRVYDEDAASQNWDKAVITKQILTEPVGKTPPKDPKETKAPDKDTPPKTFPVLSEAAQTLTMGKLMIIKGTEVSFYIPPTGVEVLVGDNGSYVQDAVTLERLEYCILLAETGNKRYVRGPEVVFPAPTEKFITKDEKGKTLRKYKAKELSETSGIYIKVTAEYEEGSKKHKAGDELFITGKETPIYYPREEHAIIKYSDESIHYATAIPAGEGRYILNRLTGEIKLSKGPKMLLLDPRREVMVRRILDGKSCALWFPGNEEALRVNEALAVVSASAEDGRNYITNDALLSNSDTFNTAYTSTTALTDHITGVPILGDDASGGLISSNGVSARKLRKATSRSLAGDDFDRKENYTPPRTLTLDTKYDGAVSISIFTGYAVNVVSKTGTRKTVKGPTTYLLQYDESLEGMELSTGTPKHDATTIRTAYLRTMNNKVSDEIKAESKDLCQVSIKLSYRVDFQGDDKRWFNVENYVGFLTGNMRSKIRNCVKRLGIQEFYSNSIEIIRDLILGECGKSGAPRPGCKFEENGMRVTDVEVLDVVIGDDEIADMLTEAQNETVSHALEIDAETRRLDLTKKKELIERQIVDIEAGTSEKRIAAKIKTADAQLKLDLANLKKRIEVDKQELIFQLEDQKTLDSIRAAELAREKKKSDQKIDIKKSEQTLAIENLIAQTEAFEKEMGAVDDKLIAAIQSSADKKLAIDMSKNMSPYAILGGNSLTDVLQQVLKGTILEGVPLKRVNGEDPDQASH